MPVSPRISTVALLSATCSISRYTSCIALLLPTMLCTSNRVLSSRRSRTFSSRSVARSDSTSLFSLIAWATIVEMMLSSRSRASKSSDLPAC